MTGKAGGARTPRRAAASQKPGPAVDPDMVWVNPNLLTAGEIEAVEEAAGMSITHYGQMNSVQGPISRAMGWVVRLRSDPDLVYEDANCGRGVRPQCGDCHCSRRLRVLYVQEAPPTPPSGGNGS